MVNNFRAIKVTCEKCGREYNTHQSAECPHERFVDLMVNNRLLTGEEIDRAIPFDTSWALDFEPEINMLIEAQDAKTASIIQAEATKYYAEKMSEAIERLRVKMDAEHQQKVRKIHKDLVALQLDSPNVYEKSRRLEEYVSSMLSRILGGK